MGLTGEYSGSRFADKWHTRWTTVMLGTWVLQATAASTGDDVQQACRAGEPVAASTAAAAPGTESPPGDIEVLRRGSLRVVRRGDYLLAFTSPGMQHDDALALQQPDYGRVQSVDVDRSGALVAIGDQLSYRIGVDLVAGRARFTSNQRFPWLSAQRCFALSQLFGTCQPARAVFSRTLQAGLIEGYDRWGRARSYAIGLAAGADATPLKAPRGGTPWYRFDVPATRGARFYTTSPAAQLYFDGQRMHECPP